MNESQSLKEKTAKGLFWGGFSSGFNQLLSLFFGIIIGRILNPSDYGKIAMLLVFSAIASNLQESGFVSALINRKDINHKDYNAVFWFNIFCGGTLYASLYFSAPLIADFYHVPELIPLSRLFFLSFMISSFGIAPRALLLKKLKIRENAIILMASQAVSGIAGLILALNGFAYWGIALQTITYVTVGVILNWHFSCWRPTLHFDFTPIKEMFGFSSKLLVTLIFTNINNNLFSVLLGRFYGEKEAGDFSQGNKWNSMGHMFITNMIDGVAQPILASVVEDNNRQLTVFRKLLRFTAFISFPAMFGFSLISKEFIVITMTAKWINSATIMQLLCIWGAFAPISFLFSRLLISRGRSSIYMLVTIGLSLFQLTAACILYNYGLNNMLYAYVLINILCLFVWIYFAKKEILLTYTHVLKDVLPFASLAFALCLAAYCITINVTNLYFSLGIKLVFIITFYPLILWRLKSVIFIESVQFLKKRKK